METQTNSEYIAPKYAILHGWHWINEDGETCSESDAVSQQHALEAPNEKPHGYCVFLRFEDGAQNLTGIEDEKDFKLYSEACDYAEKISTQLKIEWFDE